MMMPAYASKRAILPSRGEAARRIAPARITRAPLRPQKFLRIRSVGVAFDELGVVIGAEQRVEFAGIAELDEPAFLKLLPAHEQPTLL